MDEQFISGLSDREARKREQSSARSANARATPGCQLVVVSRNVSWPSVRVFPDLLKDFTRLLVLLVLVVPV